MSQKMDSTFCLVKYQQPCQLNQFEVGQICPVNQKYGIVFGNQIWVCSQRTLFSSIQ